MKIKYIQYIIVFVSILFLAKTNNANSDSTCVAAFSYEVYQNIGKPSIIKFTNESTGNPTQFSWDFGDGSISNIKDPIHYFPENGQYQVKLTVANNTNSDEIIKTVEINVSLTIDFTYKLDSNNLVPNTYRFTGIINGYYDHIMWNFGDQIIQNIEDTIHSYAKQDEDYQVVFTAQYYFNDTSILTKALAKGLTTSQYFDLGGQIYLGDSLMNNPSNQSDTGIAYLFRVDNNQLVPIDTNVFQKLGYFWFDTKLKAHYLIQVSLAENSTHFGAFAPTYLGNTTYWDQAEIINLSQDKYREDVSLIPITNSSGNKSLSGNVQDLIDIDKEEEVLVYLYNTENELIDYRISKSFSNFEFSHLEKGHYLLGADVPGVYSRQQLVFVDNSKENKFKSLNEIPVNNIFPNPAGDYTLITYDNLAETGSKEIQIYNSNGRLIKSINYPLKTGINYIHLDLTNMASGILYLKFSQSEGEIYKLIHY